jgi:hypothetical protein
MRTNPNLDAFERLTLENHMTIINHILSLPVSDDTINLALICAALVVVRVGLSIVLHNLSR